MSSDFFQFQVLIVCCFLKIFSKIKYNTHFLEIMNELDSIEDIELDFYLINLHLYYD